MNKILNFSQIGVILSFVAAQVTEKKHKFSNIYFKIAHLRMSVVQRFVVIHVKGKV